MSLSRRQKTFLTLLVFYWPAIFILTHMPLEHVSKWVLQVHISDKTLHYLAYLLLSFLLWVSIRPLSKVNWRRYDVWWLLLVIVWYGAFDEWLQSYVGRNCDVMDFFANLAGALTSLILLSIFSFWPVWIILTVVVIFALTNLTRVDMAALLPMTNMLFHLIAYAFLGLIWTRYLHKFLLSTTSKSKELTLAITIPIAFLFAVKLVSAISGKAFKMQDIIISIGSITIVVVLYYTTVLCSRKNAKKTPVKEEVSKT